MKLKVISGILLATSLSANTYAAPITMLSPPNGFDLSPAESKLQTAVDPADAVVNNSNEDDFFADSLDGVGRLLLGGSLCTTTLINSRQAITAAHCFGNPVGDGSTTGLVNSGIQGLFGTINYNGSSFVADDVYSVEQVDINPLWLGSTGGTNPNGTEDVYGDGDIAVVTFTESIFDRTFYDILLDNTFEEFFVPHVRVGRGTAGNLGVSNDEFSDSQRRIGYNEYDLFASNLQGVLDSFDEAGSRAMYDCDDGTEANNIFPRVDFLDEDPNSNFIDGSLGLGDDEACADSGDSGGANFIVNPITGELTIVSVTSFGAINQGFGGFGGDTRTAAHADWLRSVVTFEASAPATLGLFSLVLLAFVRVNRKTK